LSRTNFSVTASQDDTDHGAPYCVPQDRIGIVVLANQDGSALGAMIVRHAMNRLLGGTRRDCRNQARARSTAGECHSSAGRQTRRGDGRHANSVVIMARTSCSTRAIRSNPRAG
jgi:hypothetical protein